MAGTEVDLSNVSDNPEDLAKLFEQLESGETPLEANKEAASPNGAAGEAPTADESASVEVKPKEGEGQPEASESDAAGVATKDGKHVIPYSVLKSERERATRAEQTLSEMQERVSFLEALVKGGSQGAKNGESARTETPQPKAGDLSNEDLEALKEDFPTVYKAVTAAMARADKLAEQLKPVEEGMRTAQAESVRSVQETVQDAIDSVPKLAHLQATDPKGFDLAKKFDAAIREEPEWQNKTLAERFIKVAEMVEAARGPIQLPNAARQNASQKPEDLKKAAQAAAAKQTRNAVPNSLSEFPAGQHAAQDDQEEATNMSPLQLAEKFSAMTPDQMDAYFRNL